MVMDESGLFQIAADGGKRTAGFHAESDGLPVRTCLLYTSVYPGSDDNAQIPVIPLPNPGEGGPVYPGGFIQPVQPIQPLPTVTYADVRFLNAAYGYPAFRVYVGNRRAARLLNFASLSAYVRLAAGYQTRCV